MKYNYFSFEHDLSHIKYKTTNSSIQKQTSFLHKYLQFKASSAVKKILLIPAKQ